jgi:hypothetical protein
MTKSGSRRTDKLRGKKRQLVTFDANGDRSESSFKIKILTACVSLPVRRLRAAFASC